MFAEQRSSPRFSVKHTGVLLRDDDRLIASCELIDISRQGARFKIRTRAKVPDRFILVLSINIGPRRRCQVVWRDCPEIGVRFLANANVPKKRKFRSWTSVN